MNHESIHVTSLEFDSFLLIRDHYTPEQAKDLVRVNNPLFTTLAAANNDYALAILMDNSTKQIASNTLALVANHIQAELDPFLMADIYNDLPHGATYYQTLGNRLVDTASSSHPDSNKVATSYAQLHKIALENPDTPIAFDFYLGDESVCKSLFLFFKKHRELIPNTVNLGIKHHQDGTTHHFPILTGKGPMDSNLRQTVKDMHRILSQSTENPHSAIAIQLSDLKHRVAAVPEHCLFIKALAQLQAKALTLLAEGDHESNQHITDLCHLLLQEWNNYLNRECSVAEVKLHCGTAIHYVRSQLQRTDINEALTSMLSAVGHLNIIYNNTSHAKLTAAPFLFFWQKSEKKSQLPEAETKPTNKPPDH